MKHAVIIFAHQLPEQLNILIDQFLYYPDFDVYIHINKKYDDIRHSITLNDRVHVSSNNVEVDWGSDNFLKAMIIMFNEVINSGKDYGQIVLCSGQDLIIREGLASFLSENSKEVFSNIYEDDVKRRWLVLNKWPANYRKLLTSRWQPARWGRAIHWQLIKHGCTWFRKKVDFDTDNITFYKNFFWGAFPLVVIKWMMQFINENPGFMSIYEGAHMTEEAFTGTLVMMSPYKEWVHFDDNGVAHDLTYVFEFIHSHPTIITKRDIHVLDERKEFFARKFDIRVDKDVVDYYHYKICK